MFVLTVTLLTHLTIVLSQFADPFVVLNEYPGGSAEIHFSSSQLSAASTAATIFIPGDSIFDVTTFSVITDRNIGIEFNYTVEIPDPENDLEVLMTLTYLGVEDKSECSIYWADGLSDVGKKIDPGDNEFEHTYAAYGIYPIHVTCTHENGTSESIPPMDIMECITTTNFLDASFAKFKTPLVFLASQMIKVDSYMQFSDNGCGTPAINWRIVQVFNGTQLIDITDFPPSTTSVLTIPAGVLQPGEYAVALEVLFPDKGPLHYIDSWIALKVALPELVTHIDGGEYVTVPVGGDIFIDASVSTDPVFDLPSLQDEPLVAIWQFLYYDLVANYETFMRTFPSSPPGIYKYSNIRNGTDYVLQIDGTKFASGKAAVVMFSLIRGERKSTAMQVIKFLTNAVPVTIKCVYNCHIGRERLFYHDKLDLDANIPSEVDKTTLNFQWQVFAFGIFGIYWRIYPATQAGYYTSGLGITSFLVEGDKLKIVLLVSGGGYATTYVRMYRTVNFIPYGGSCTLTNSIGITSVVAAREWLTLDCNNWKATDDRKPRDAIKDLAGMITYNVRQNTPGAKVEEEPILSTRAKKSFVVLKVGDPYAFFATTLYIRIADMYGNYRTISLLATATPPFDTTAVTPSLNGASLVASYTEVDYPFDEQQLRDMGKSDMIISLVSAVCSIVHLIELPIWEPPVPRVLGTGGTILDLSPQGNADVGDIHQVSEAAKNDSLDPATVKIQETVAKMTKLLKDVVDDTIINGARKGDTVLSSYITNAFNNLAAKSQYTDADSKHKLVLLGEIVGIDVLKEQNTTKDRAAEIEAASGELYYMFQSVLNAVVPDDLLQHRPVPDFKSATLQLDNMMTVIGQNISLQDSLISQKERAVLYQQMQNRLRWETDQKKAAARDAARMAKKIAQDIQSKLKICATCSNEGSNTTDQLVKKNTGSVMAFETSATQTSHFKLDGLSNALNERRKKRSADGHQGEAETVDVSAFEMTENVYMYDSDGTSSFVSSNILRVDVKARDEQINPGYMTFDQTVQTPEPEMIIPEVDGEDASEFMYHQFLYQKASDEFCIIVIPNPDNGTSTNITFYEVYLRFATSPSVLEYDLLITLKEEENWQFCVKPDSMGGHTGLTYLAVSLPGEKKSVPYNLTLITVSCLTWDEAAEKWHTDKCVMTWVPYENKIECKCNDITDMVFANSFFVAPNSIDFSSVFLKFSPLNQAAVMATLIGIFLIFILFVVFLIDLDKRDVLKWGITPLRDNYICDKHYYIIKVMTGMRRGAGTKSRVAFILTGDKSNTGPRELFDGIREEFSTGSSLSFFMATGKYLGNIEHLSIWHDNSGENDDATWYLNQVIVYDLTAREAYTFVAERWLSVDNSVQASLKSNPKDVPIKFESRFFFQTRDRLSESHMWVSIMYRPQTSTFTRVQRAGCALVYIMLNMIANAMYFNPNPNYQSPPLLQAGPFRFTSQQIFISMMCALLTTPPVMFLILLFKRTKRRPLSTGKSCCSCFKLPCSPFCKRLFRTRKGELERQREELLRTKLLTPDVPDFSGALYLPFWFVYIAWFIVFGAVVTSAFFIMLYSMEWGKQKSEEWLTSFLLSLFESMLFVDPITVICIAFVLACLIRSNSQDTNINVPVVIENYRKVIGEDEDSVPSTMKVLQSIKSDYDSYLTIPRNVTPPLEGDNLVRAAEHQRKYNEMIAVLKDIIVNIFFMMIVFSICFANRDDRSYAHREEIVNRFVSPSGTQNFEGITRPGELIAWINDTAFPTLFPQTDYEGTSLHWSDKEYTVGTNDYRLGPPRLRQLRVKQDVCEIPYVGTVDCYGEYSITSEDEGSYCLRWNEPPCADHETLFNVSLSAWTFTSAFDVWGLPIPGMYKTYGGGGYMATFDVSLSVSVNILNELYTTLWIDRQTRATMFEFTLYNPATNIFIYNIFMVEFPETGGAVTGYSIYPLRLDTHHGATGTYTLFCEIIFFLLLIYLLVKICTRIYQQRLGYFKQFWQVYEIFIFLTGASAIGVFFVRLMFTSITINKYLADSQSFVNFSHIVLWDQILLSLLSVLVFMSTIRILQALGTTKKISAIVKVFKNCGGDLFWYSMAFIYMFFGFCILGMLLFGSHLQNYMSMYQTMGMLFISMIGKSRYSDLAETQPILAQIFFVFYIVTVVFFVLTIFLSILGSSIDEVIHDSRADTNEDLIEFMMKQFRALIVKPTNPVNEKPVLVEKDTPSENHPKISMKYREDSALEKFMNREATPVIDLQLPKHPSPKYSRKRLEAKVKRGKTAFTSE